MTHENGGIAKMAAHGIFWSIVQNWGGRMMTTLLLIALARILQPADFGLASAALLVLLLISIVAEFGFGDAIVQRQELDPVDINLPFFTSTATSLLIAITVALNADLVEKWLEVPGLAPVVTALVLTAPFNTVMIFQDINYRRHFNFRSLATRTFVANLVGAVVSIGCALSGMGVWSFVAQTWVATLVSLVWLWSRPLWRPSLTLRPATFLSLAGFGGPVLAHRLVDFVGSRFIEFLILGRFGVVVFGIYSVGSRLYQIMMQLLQGALSDISLRVLSTISHDRERMAEIYFKSITLAAYMIAPIFVLISALAPEVCDVVFGAKWSGVDRIAMPLLALGAVQCVQYLNGPYIAARGKPWINLLTGTIRAIAPISAFFIFDADTVEKLTMIFVLSQLVSSPVSFSLLARELNVPLFRIVKTLAPAVVVSSLSFLAVVLARSYLGIADLPSLIRGIILGVVFVSTNLLMIAIFDRQKILLLYNFAMQKIRNRKNG